MIPRIICITLFDDSYIRNGNEDAPQSIPMSEVRRHFKERGVHAQFYFGLHAPKLGVNTVLPYTIDGGLECMTDKSVGCWLSHRALWTALLLLPDDEFMIVEDDVGFPENWRERVERAREDAGDFDMLYLGSCCTEGKPQRHIAGEVHDVRWPFCMHGYIVRRRGLEVLIKTQDEAHCYAPIDISVAMHSLSAMGKVYTVLPRILEQRTTVLHP